MTALPSVSVLHGGPSSEHDISVITAREVIAALRGGGHRVRPVYVDRAGRWHFGGDADSSAQREGDGRHFTDALRHLATLADDVAFLGFHGTFGEDGKVQAALELAGLRYTASGVTATAVAMDKPMARRVLASFGLDVAAAVELSTATIEPEGAQAAAASLVAALGLPVVVKVPAGGSSVGIEIPRDEAALRDTLERLSVGVSSLLCEEFITGVELTSSVLAGDGGVLEQLPVVEIAPKGERFFDYEAKYDPSLTDEIVPARIPAEIEQKVREIGLIAHKALGCSGVSRTDVIWDRGERCVVLETNTLPGLTPASLLPKAAAAAGVDYLTLLRRIVSAAGQKQIP